MTKQTRRTKPQREYHKFYKIKVTRRTSPECLGDRGKVTSCHTSYGHYVNNERVCDLQRRLSQNGEYFKDVLISFIMLSQGLKAIVMCAINWHVVRGQATITFLSKTVFSKQSQMPNHETTLY